MNKIILQRTFKGWPITQLFGETEFAKAHPTYYSGGVHKGIDFGMPEGTPIQATHSGIVVRAVTEPYNGRGKFVIIWDQKQRIATKYFHMSYVNVKKGDYVEERQCIGAVGNTGFSKGSHLHFSLVRVDEEGFVIDIKNRYQGNIDPYDKNIVEWTKD